MDGIPCWSAECRTGNGRKLSSSQAEPGKAINSDVALFPSISCATSCAPARLAGTVDQGFTTNDLGLCAKLGSNVVGAVIRDREVHEGISGMRMHFWQQVSLIVAQRELRMDLGSRGKPRRKFPNHSRRKRISHIVIFFVRIRHELLPHTLHKTRSRKQGLDSI